MAGAGQSAGMEGEVPAVGEKKTFHHSVGQSECQVKLS